MEITKEQFERYESLRESGDINMCDVKSVCGITELSKDEVLFIMENYEELSNKYLVE